MTGEQFVKRTMVHLRTMAREATNPYDRNALEFAIANLWHVENPQTVGQFGAAIDKSVSEASV